MQNWYIFTTFQGFLTIFTIFNEKPSKKAYQQCTNKIGTKMTDFDRFFLFYLTFSTIISAIIPIKYNIHQPKKCDNSMPNTNITIVMSIFKNIASILNLLIQISIIPTLIFLVPLKLSKNQIRNHRSF